MGLGITCSVGWIRVVGTTVDGRLLGKGHRDERIQNRDTGFHLTNQPRSLRQAMLLTAEKRGAMVESMNGSFDVPQSVLDP